MLLMAGLFVERLAVRVPDQDCVPLTPTYSERLNYNITGDGEPFVAASLRNGGTVTFTKVQDEQDDADPDFRAGTITFTRVKDEQDDADPDQTLTKTFVATESDDQDT